MKFNLSLDGDKKEFEILDKDGEYEFRYEDKNKTYTIEKLWGRNILIKDDNNKVYNVFVEKFEEGHCVFFKGRSFTIKDATSRKHGGGFDIEGEITIKSPLPGQIKKVFKKVDDEVEEGESILVLEAMKMENEIKSPKKGVIKTLSVKEGGSVDPQAELFSVE
ncbi:MAG: acetyl-CoA carboxylase biotin carboxyl carrier protein subunit [Acidobacteriota bacterium]